MSIDVFGHSLDKTREVLPGPPGVGFKLTEDGDFDIENRRLCNVASSVNLTDTVNLRDLELIKKDIKKDLKKLMDALFFLQKKFVEIMRKLTIETSPKTIDVRDILSTLI